MTAAVRRLLSSFAALVLASACTPAPASPVADDGGVVLPPDDAAVPSDAEVVADAGSDPGQDDAGPIEEPAPDAGIAPDVRELGPGLALIPVAPIVLADTRRDAACGRIAPLGPARLYGPLKLDLSACAGIELPADARAVAIAVTLIAKGAAGGDVTIGSATLRAIPSVPTVHHQLAPLLGPTLVIQSSSREEIHVVVELTAIAADDRGDRSAVRMLAAPARVLETTEAGRALEPGVARELDLVKIADEAGVPLAAVTGVIATARVSPRAPCAEGAFELAMGPARDDAAARRLVSVAGCEEDRGPWSRGLVVPALRGRVVVAADGVPPDLSLDVVAVLTDDRTTPGALVHVPARAMRVSAHAGEGLGSVALPVRGAVGALGWIVAHASAPGALAVGGAAIELDAAEERAWAPIAIDDGSTIAIDATAPTGLELTLDALLAPE